MPNLKKLALGFACLLALNTLPVFAQDATIDDLDVRQVTTHIGEMDMAIENTDREINDSIRFEPYQALFDMVFRRDVVYLMRHGPTDWSKRDEPDVAPTDCDNQRIMSEQGRVDMRNLGSLLASNRIVPSQIVVSEWCRNQQTLEQLIQGYSDVDADVAKAIPVETDPALNLLLSLQGAPSTQVLEDRIASWQGDPDRTGPLLIISHYTNIEELTQFKVFEGEILVLDPTRNNRVLGYLRLASASPDVGHFADVFDSPLQREEQALDMVERYYVGLNNRDFTVVDGILSEDWYTHTQSQDQESQDASGFFDELDSYLIGMPDAQFQISSLHFADDVVTVIGVVQGTHSGPLFGIPATGRDVSFGAIAVHKVSDNEILESWQIPDRLSLLRQIR